ncbi:putative WRKY transcription factor 19 [Phytophthora citrophthora]|uniref:WRKY transcription factor 19 n=1 Tax=Phytophthora citrophthora TaxID=4793 RepID=A0AAD9H0H3_9STRA|nr:putative WRKY transcription factor 19 [Phytophthora citrophthora]
MNNFTEEERLQGDRKVGVQDVQRACGRTQPVPRLQGSVAMTSTQEPKLSPDKRKLCCVEGCKSQARAFNRCKRHGGSKRCSSPGCTKSVQSRGLCIRHGGGSRCQESGCTRASQSQGRCKMHGGGRPCVVDGCDKKAHLKRLCRKHGGGTKCCMAGCDKWAQRQGMCMTHAKAVGGPSSGLGMLDTNNSGSKPLRHDAETFRVAEELIMLSNRATSTSSIEEKPNDSPSNISGFFDHKKTKAKSRSSHGAAHKDSDRNDGKLKPARVLPTQSADMINSRCDVSQSDLLKEHRVRFRRVRRRWNIAQRTKKEEYLARFHVQGIPLVQHLETLTHWRSSGASWGPADANWCSNNPSQGEFIPRGGSSNLNPSRKIGGNSLRKARGGNDSLPLAIVDAPSMGNYDRDAHLRMQLLHRITGQHQTVAGISHQLPHRMKNAPPTSNNSSSTTPYFHHLLDRSNSSANSLLFNSSATYGDSAPVSTNTSGKRPRSSNNTSNTGNFLAPLGFPSPPPFETDHPLPDLNTNWGFNSRNGSRSNSSMSSATTSSTNVMTNSHSSSNVTTTSSLSGIGGMSSPNGASMFAGVDSFMPDYDPTLYSLWNTPSGGNMMGYETENDSAQGQHQQVQPPLYMTSDDELKMDYPQLSEFNQDLDSYLNDTMETGGPSPTTPLGTSTASSMMKMDNLVTTDRRTGAGAGLGETTGSREPQLERLLAPPPTTEYLVKRERGLAGLDDTSGRLNKKSRGAYDDAYTAKPGTSAMTSGSTPSANPFRSLAKNSTIEPKRAVMPPLGSYHGGQSLLMPTSGSTGHTGVASSVTRTSTTPVSIITSTPTGSSKVAKRPRSRQCEFPGCQNRARSHQKCKKHGGAHQCVFEGCTKNSQSRGLCIAHGGGSRCKREGCVRAAQSKGLCKSHGGGEFCAVEGCNKKAHLKHLCRTHGGGVRCKFEECAKWAQRKGWCMAHAKEFST